ncbi:uncharacterized protein LOC134522085 [Chroicocephalus ridibundus]|uniref:uncharacterized protein LOC134522085 n=1 Tax=Chroicocephalus ridibundus TaxID=1192867 RepID=UPI002FDCDEAF
MGKGPGLQQGWLGLHRGSAGTKGTRRVKGEQGYPSLSCIAGSWQSSLHMAASLLGLQRGGSQDSRDGETGQARGLLPALPSPSCCRGGDVGSCSAKPCSFSPLKPDYSGGACACVRACSGGEEEEFHNKCLQPRWAQLPQSRPRDGGIAPAVGNGAEGGLPPLLLSPCLRHSSWAPGARHAGARQEVSSGAWRWTLWLLVGLGGRCCSSPWGLEADAMAVHGARRWTLWLLMVFRGGCLGYPWGLEVDAVAPHGVWRWMPWLPMGLGGGCHGYPWGLEVDALATHGAWRWMPRLPMAFGGGCYSSP